MHRELTLIVGGLPSSGVSTFINGVVGLPLLPTDIGRVSCGCVDIRHTDENMNVWSLGDEVEWLTTETHAMSAAQVAAWVRATMFVSRLNASSSAPHIRLSLDLTRAKRVLGLPPRSSLRILDQPQPDEGLGAWPLSQGRTQGLSVVVWVVDITTLYSTEEVDAAVAPLAAMGFADDIVVLLNKRDRLSNLDRPTDEVARLLYERIARVGVSAGVLPISALALHVGSSLSSELAACLTAGDHDLLGPVERFLKASRGLMTLSAESRGRLRGIVDAFDIEDHVSWDDAVWLSQEAVRASGLTGLVGRLARLPLAVGWRERLHHGLSDAKTRAVALAFAMLTEADGAVTPEEEDLISALLLAYIRRFGDETPADNNGAATQDQEDGHALIRLLSKARFGPSELDWLIKAMHMVASVDGVVHPNELATIDLFKTYARS